MDPTEQYKSNSINLYARDSSGSKLTLYDASGDGKFTSVVKNFTLAFSAAGESGASNNHVIHIPQVHTIVSGYAMGVGWALGDLRSSRDTLVLLALLRKLKTVMRLSLLSLTVLQV